jgi:hypothetical protein
LSASVHFGSAQAAGIAAIINRVALTVVRITSVLL